MYQYHSGNGCRNTKKMAAEWKVYQYSYKNGRSWKNVWVQSVNNWRGFENVPVQFRKWSQARDQYQFCCKMLCRGQNDSWSIKGTVAHSKKYNVLATTHLIQLNNKLDDISSQIDMTGIGDEPFEDKYANWRRQRKYYKLEKRG